MTNGYGHKHDDAKPAKKTGTRETKKPKARSDDNKTKEDKEQATQQPKP